MINASVMVGKQEINGSTQESYQLLIGNDIIPPTNYTPKQGNYEKFLKTTTKDLVDRILKRGVTGKIVILDGCKIELPNNLVKIDKLEASKFCALSNQLDFRLSVLFEGRAVLNKMAENN